jgi:hypothetical protein
LLMTEKSYSASLTGEPLQFFESKVVAGLMLNGLSYSEIKQKVYDGNLFNYKTKKSIFKRVASVYRRLKGLDRYLLDRVANASNVDVKAILLFSLMRSNRLFNEFMVEVVRNKFLALDFVLSKKDVNVFFDRKKDQSEKVAHWKEYTIYRLSISFFSILSDSTLLEQRDDKYVLKKMVLSQSLYDYFLNHDKIFLGCIGV